MSKHTGTITAYGSTYEAAVEEAFANIRAFLPDAASLYAPASGFAWDTVSNAKAVAQNGATILWEVTVHWTWTR